MHYVLYTIIGVVALKVRMATKLFKVRLVYFQAIAQQTAFKVAQLLKSIHTLQLFHARKDSWIHIEVVFYFEANNEVRKKTTP